MLSIKAELDWTYGGSPQVVRHLVAEVRMSYGFLSFRAESFVLSGFDLMAESCCRSFLSRFCCGVSHCAEIPFVEFCFYAEVML